MDSLALSAKWFTVYYAALGIIFTAGGGYLMFRKTEAAHYLNRSAQAEKPPVLFIRILKYLFLFTLPALVLSFYPFSWIELLFSLWSLLLIYIAGSQLVRWQQTRTLIKASDMLPQQVFRFGAILMAVGWAMFLLTYWIVERTSVG